MNNSIKLKVNLKKILPLPIEDAMVDVKCKSVIFKTNPSGYSQITMGTYPELIKHASNTFMII